MRTIDVGDKVVIHFTNNEPFGSCHIVATINSMPADVGDQIYAAADWYNNGTKTSEISVNPNCCEYAGMTLVKKHEDIIRQENNGKMPF